MGLQCLFTIPSAQKADAIVDEATICTASKFIKYKAQTNYKITFVLRISSINKRKLPHRKKKL